MNAEPGYLRIYREMDPPYERFEPSMLGPEFPRELEVVSRLWFACGYRPGIAAYLNFFLLREFIVTHDTAFPPRFQSFRSMANSFYQTDLFIRDVTDSGARPTGGISSPAVREALQGIMRRHRRISIPDWMMTYFGFSLMEMVEKHAHNILLLGEMVGVSSRYGEISAMLPEGTREVFRGLYPKVAPGPLARVSARVMGRVLMKKAVGAPRKAVPVGG